MRTSFSCRKNVVLTAVIMMLLGEAYGKCREYYLAQASPGVIHTSCKPRIACNRKIFSPDAKAKQEIVDAHNNIRRRFAKGQEPGYPPAADMIELSWSDELGEMSEDHAARCYRGHDGLSERFSTQHWAVGQNLGFVKSSAELTTVNYTGVVYGMFYLNEINHMYPTDVDSLAFSNKKGHLTQVIWSRTSEVGGAACIYKTDYWYLDVTFEYGNAGNLPRYAVYFQGPPCSQCPPNATCHDGLCRVKPKDTTAANSPEALTPMFKIVDSEDGENSNWFPLIVAAVITGVLNLLVYGIYQCNVYYYGIPTDYSEEGDDYDQSGQFDDSSYESLIGS